MGWQDLLHLFYEYQIAGCLEGQIKTKRRGADKASARLRADSKYLAADGRSRKRSKRSRKRSKRSRKRSKREGQDARPMVEDPACEAVFGRLRQEAEEACKMATGKEYVGVNCRLFFNGNKDENGNRRAHGPHVDGVSRVKGGMRMISHMVPPDYQGINGLKIPANHAGPTIGRGEQVREGGGVGVGGVGGGGHLC